MVYLGGLGDSDDELSEHLRSRREVEAILLAGAPTTALRAGIVIGDGGISWEILRQLVVRLPVMVTPRWVQTRTQPIALADAVSDLVGVLGRTDMVGEAYDIGGPEALDLPGDDAHHGSGDGSSAPGRPRAAAHPPPVVALAAAHHRCRPADGAGAGGLVGQRGRGPRRPHPGPPRPHSDALRGGGGGCPRRSGDPPRTDRTRMRLPDLLALAPDRGPGDPVPIRRRRWVAVAATLVVGTALLAATLRVEQGSDGFTALALVAAAVWIGGAFLSGPIPLRPVHPSSSVRVAIQAAVLGGVAFLVFLVASRIGQRLPGIDGALDSILAKADAGSRWVVLGVALVNGLAEEIFFRGAVYAAVPPARRVALVTVIYVAVTVATGNIALVVAAAVMGTLFAFERRSSGSILAPVVTHLTWSTLMIVVLPR